MKQESVPPKILGYHLRASTRRTFKHVIIFLGMAVMAAVYLRSTSYYFSFKRKPARYFAEFGSACDSVLIDYPLGTNWSMEIPTNDLRLPKMIRDLHPEKIGASHNKVWVFVHGGHVNGLAVIWEPVWDSSDQNQTNTWALSITSGEGADATLYVTNRLTHNAVH